MAKNWEITLYTFGICVYLKHKCKLLMKKHAFHIKHDWTRTKVKLKSAKIGPKPPKNAADVIHHAYLTDLEEVSYT